MKTNFEIATQAEERMVRIGQRNGDVVNAVHRLVCVAETAVQVTLGDAVTVIFQLAVGHLFKNRRIMNIYIYASQLMRRYRQSGSLVVLRYQCGVASELAGDAPEDSAIKVVDEVAARWTEAPVEDRVAQRTGPHLSLRLFSKFEQDSFKYFLLIKSPID